MNWRTGAKFQALFNLATFEILNNQLCQVFHFFERVNKGELKMLLKIDRSRYIAISLKS